MKDSWKYCSDCQYDDLPGDQEPCRNCVEVWGVDFSSTPGWEPKGEEKQD
jgi:hypothetical protein